MRRPGWGRCPRPCPRELMALSDGVYCPPLRYTWAGFWAVLVSSSPKSQLQAVNLLPVLSTPGQVKRTGSGSAPMVALAANRTVGASTAMFVVAALGSNVVLVHRRQAYLVIVDFGVACGLGSGLRCLCRHQSPTAIALWRCAIFRRRAGELHRQRVGRWSDWRCKSAAPRGSLAGRCRCRLAPLHW